jgi:hypothetical protein
VTTAPLVIVPMSAKQVYLDRYAQPDKGWTDRDERRCPVPFWHIDTGMAALLILLTVADEGLGALYFGIALPSRRWGRCGPWCLCGSRGGAAAGQCGNNGLCGTSGTR